MKVILQAYMARKRDLQVAFDEYLAADQELLALALDGIGGEAGTNADLMAVDLLFRGALAKLESKVAHLDEISKEVAGMLKALKDSK